MTLTRFGITRLAGNTGLLSPFTSLLVEFPSGVQAEIIALTFYRPQYWSTVYEEMLALDESKAQVAATGSLGDLPIIVVSGSPDVSRLPSNFPVERIRLTFRDLQEELAGLSSQSTQIVCNTCDHYTPMTNPALVVDAIRQEISIVRR